MKKLLLLAVATLMSVGAMAIDKVAKKPNVLTISQIIGGDQFFTLEKDGQFIQISKNGNQDVTYGTDQIGKYKLETPPAFGDNNYTDKYLIRCYKNDGSAYNFWGRDSKHYLNMQPGGLQFCLGLEGKNGQDGDNLAVFSLEAEPAPGTGIAFKNMSNNKYLNIGNGSDSPVYLSVSNSRSYIAAEVEAADAEVKVLPMEDAAKNALDQARSDYGTDATEANLDAYAEAVNAAIDANLAYEKLHFNVGDDATKFIPNAHFRTSDVSAWNMNGKSDPTVDVGAHDCEFYQKDFNMSMTIHGMKKGTYQIGMQAFQRPAGATAAAAQAYESGTNISIAQLYTTAEETEVPDIMSEKSTTSIFGDGSGAWPNDSKFEYNSVTYYIPNSVSGAREWFDAGHYNTTAKAVVTEDGGDLTFGFKGQNVSGGWILFDNFTLTYISEAVLVDAAESDKLLAKVPSGKMGAAVKSALDAAVTALEADKTNGTLYNDLKDAIAAAESSIAYYAVVTPYAEKYAALDATGKAAVTWPANNILGSDYTNGTLDEKGFPNAANMINTHAIVPLIKGQIAMGGGANVDLSSYLANAACNEANGGWEGDVRWNRGEQYEGAPDNSYFDAWNGSAKTYNMHQTIKLPAGIYQLKAATRAAAGVVGDIYFTEDKNGTNHNAAINNTGNAGGDLGRGWSWTVVDGIVVAADKEVNIGFYVNVNNNWAGADDFRLIYLGDAKATMAVSAEAKYGTFCAPFDVTIPGGVQAFTAAVNGESVQLTDVTTTIPANTPVVLKAESGLAATPFYGKAVAGTPTNGALTGVYADTEAPNDSYILASIDGVVAFYQVENTDKPTVGANRCYLTVSSPSSVKAFFFEDDATAMKTIEVAGESKVVYDLMGRKVEKAGKGIYIVNGKKVMF